MRILIALALVAAASAVSEKFRINVLEKGHPVSEDVEVTEEYATLAMPEHNGLEAATIHTHFKSGMTVRMMPKRQVCYFTQDDPAQLPELQQWMPQTIKSVWQNVPNITTVYRNVGVMSDLSVLTPEMQQLCQGMPLFKLIVDRDQKLQHPRVEKMDPSLSRTPTIEPCRATFQGQICNAYDNHCHYIQMCHWVTNPDTGIKESICDQDHRYGTVRCCTPCCLMQVPGSSLPYCMGPEIDHDLINCEGYGY